MSVQYNNESEDEDGHLYRLVVETTGPDSDWGVGFIAYHEGEGTAVVLRRDAVAALVAQLQSWLDRTREPAA